jgi:thiol-disulfide isomerase/thioredoxin
MAILQTLLLPLVLAAATLVGDGWLGIRLADAERPTIGEVFPRSPAAKAGLKSGDVIVSVNDKATRTVEALFEVFQGLNAGDWARLDVLRGGKKRKFKVQLAARPVEGRQRVGSEEKPARRPGKKPAKVAERDGRPAFLGIEIEESERGLVVTSLVKGAVAARAGIKPGDQLRSFNGAPVVNIDQLDKIMKGLHARDKIRIGYRRGGRNRETSLVAMARPGARPAAEGRAPARRAPIKRASAKRAPTKRAPTKRTAKKTEKAAPRNASMAGFSSSLESSLSKARRSGRPVLLVFGASWCVNCETLKKSLAHSSLRRMLGQYERVWIDTDQQSALADKYNVESLPHTMILSSGGKVQKTIIGYQPAQILAQHLRAGLSAGAPTKRAPAKRAPTKRAPAKRKAAPKVRSKAQPKKAKVRPKKVQPKKVQPKKVQPKKVRPKKAKAQPKKVQPRRVRPAADRSAPARRTAPARNTAATELQRLRSEVQRLRTEQRKQGRLLERILRELQKKK